MLRLAFDFIITWRETRTRPNAYDLTIKVTYRVGLSDVEVPDKVYDELAKAYDEGGYVPEGDDELENANEWLLDNIRQEDAMDWEFEIDDFQDE